jgi:hypothetical protein
VPKFVWKNKNGMEKNKKAFKWTIFLIIFLLPMSFMYLISSDKLLLMIEEGPETM